MSSVPSVTLSNGTKMPVIGLGTWQSKPEEIDLAVRTALDAGYRHIDTATIYKNEADIGNTLEAYFATGKLKREDIFLVTKLWCTHNRPEDVESALRRSLALLKTDYVDLYLIHLPGAYNHDMTQQDSSVRVEDVWKGMETVYDKGLTKAIGVSNFNAEQVERILQNAKVPIHNNQVELHLHFQQHALHEICRKHNVSVCAFAPIGSPGHMRFDDPNERDKISEPLKNPLVVRLAEKYKKTPAQILLRHLLQRDIIIIPKSINPKRIQENFDIFDFELNKEELEELNNQPQGGRIFLQEALIGHPEDPFKNER